VRRLALIPLALALVLPATAAAQSQTFGSPLTTAPNLNVGCEMYPYIADVSGSYGLKPSGVADCTWRQSGVFGVTSGDPRFSSVPGDGTITRVEVLAGPNPAPLRFVVFSQLGNAGGTENFQCCFFVSETAPVALTPNVVNTFAVNIPVQRNTLDGIRRFDLMGISAAAGTGTLPLAQVAPRINNFDIFTPGSVNAGFFYPRLSANGQDQGGGRREEGVPGIEVLVRWTWQPPGAVVPQPGGGGGGGQGGVIGPVGPALAGRGATPVRRGNALVDLICNGNAACAGQLQLLAARAGGAAALAPRAGGSAAEPAPPARGAAKPKKKAKKPKSYGKARFSIPAGGKATIKVKLNKAGKKALKKKPKGVTVRLRMTPAGGAPIESRVKLKR
jgi:hypothetical protein